MAPKSEGRLSTVSWLMLALKEFRRAPSADLGVGDVSQEWRYDAGRITDTSSEMAPINILCMDGGGIRGRQLLAMVEEMEEIIGGPLQAHFDLIAGTSVGGCGSLFLSRYPERGAATKMGRKALQQLQNRCFKQQNWARLFTRGFLCRDARREFLLELCGANQPLRTSGAKAFAVAARRMDGSLEPFLFRTYELPEETCARGPHQGAHKVSLWEAIEATSAAPFLFPRSRLEVELQLEEEEQQEGRATITDITEGDDAAAAAAAAAAARGGEALLMDATHDDTVAAGMPPPPQQQQQQQQQQHLHDEPREAAAAALEQRRRREPTAVWLADGGLVANDPTAIALREARALWPNRPIGTVISLGTGSMSPLGADVGDPSRSRIGRAVRALGGPSARYYRINPSAPGISMIDCNEAKLTAMEQHAKEHLRNSLDAREACARLAENYAARRTESWREVWPPLAHCHRAVQLARVPLQLTLALLARLLLLVLRLVEEWRYLSARATARASSVAQRQPQSALSPAYGGTQRGSPMLFASSSTSSSSARSSAAPGTAVPRFGWLLQPTKARTMARPYASP